MDKELSQCTFAPKLIAKKVVAKKPRSKSKKEKQIVVKELPPDDKKLSTIDGSLDSVQTSEVKNYQEAESDLKLRKAVVTKEDTKTVIKVNNYSRRSKEERKLHMDGTLTNSFISQAQIDDSGVFIPKVLRQKPQAKKPEI